MLCLVLVTSSSSLAFDSSPFLLSCPVYALSVLFLFFGTKLWFILIAFYWEGEGEGDHYSMCVKTREDNFQEWVFSCHHVLEIKFSSSGLTARAFTCSAILGALVIVSIINHSFRGMGGIMTQICLLSRLAHFKPIYLLCVAWCLSLCCQTIEFCHVMTSQREGWKAEKLIMFLHW